MHQNYSVEQGAAIKGPGWPLPAHATNMISNKTDSPSEIDSQMRRLAEASDMLENAASELWRRLQPVMRGPENGGAVPGAAPNPIESPLGNQLAIAGDRIYGVTGSLNSLIAALRI